MSILKTVSEGPDNQKKIFALIGAIVLTGVIVFVWYSFGSNRGSDDSVAAISESKLSSVSPWQVIKEEFSKAFSGINNSLPGLTSSTTSEISSSTVLIEVVTLEADASTSTVTSLSTSTSN
jgi:hypothetical protein